jgi:hypothetical protein
MAFDTAPTSYPLVLLYLLPMFWLKAYVVSKSVSRYNQSPLFSTA